VLQGADIRLHTVMEKREVHKLEKKKSLLSRPEVEESKRTATASGKDTRRAAGRRQNRGGSQSLKRVPGRKRVDGMFGKKTSQGEI